MKYITLIFQTSKAPYTPPWKQTDRPENCGAAVPNNTGLWLLLLRDFNFRFLNFVLAQPDTFHVFKNRSLEQVFGR